MKQDSLSKLVMAALFAALTCIATLVIQLRVTPTGGYVNLGDCLVLLCAWLLAPVYGMAAAGIGSMMADIISGYAVYAPATLIIKGLMALASGAIFRWCTRHAKNRRTMLAGCLLSAVAAETIMSCGYCGYEAWVLGLGPAALLGMPGNILQAACGIVSSTAVYSLLQRSRALEQQLERLK